MCTKRIAAATLATVFSFATAQAEIVYKWGSDALEAAATGKPIAIPQPPQPEPPPVVYNENRDYRRPIVSDDVERVAKIRSSSNIDEIRRLCALATKSPKIGMTMDEAFASTWCTPWDRPHITTTKYGQSVSTTHCPGQRSPCHLRHMYFENGYLTMMSED